jgi:hypothetical protein
MWTTFAMPMNGVSISAGRLHGGGWFVTVSLGAEPVPRAS